MSMKFDIAALAARVVAAVKARVAARFARETGGGAGVGSANGSSIVSAASTASSASSASSASGACADGGNAYPRAIYGRTDFTGGAVESHDHGKNHVCCKRGLHGCHGKDKSRRNGAAKRPASQILAPKRKGCRKSRPASSLTAGAKVGGVASSASVSRRKGGAA